MRLFVAIEIPPAIGAQVAAVARKLADTRADVRWVEAGHYHVTVKFVGEVEDGRVAELAERISKAAQQVPAFEVEVEGVDRLPERGPVRVITSRILSPDQRMTRLHRLVDSAAGGMGLPMDTRVLVPHLTLGRVKSNHGINRLLRQLEKHDLDFFGSFVVERVGLFRSTLGAGPDGGPVYEAVVRAPLRPAAEEEKVT